MKKIAVINASPRSGWNTDLLLREAAKGAEEKGAQIEFLTFTGWKNTQDVYRALAASCRSTRGCVSAKTDLHLCWKL